jgi:hypothetical protein
MPEDERPPELMAAYVPIEFGAVFKQGKHRGRVYDPITKEDLLPVRDVEDKRERMAAFLSNIRHFSDGHVPNPEGVWRGVIDSWESELRHAADPNRGNLSREELREAEKEMKAMMAVSASARAMENSAGTAAAYVGYITATLQGSRPDLDKQDYWADVLLHRDKEKLQRVINNPLVSYFYRQLIRDAGIRNLDWNEEKGEWEGEGRKVDPDRAFGSKLLDYLSNKDPYLKGPEKATWEKKDGFNDYIAEVLLDKLLDESKWGNEEEEFLKYCWQKGKFGFESEHLWAAARLAADAFLADQYTQWEYEIRDFLKEQDIRLNPCPEWGGNPFRAVLEPSFLLKEVKKMYPDDEAFHNLLNTAFRPDDLINPDAIKGVRDKKTREKIAAAIKKALPTPSATTHLKMYARYSDAWWVFYGGASRGGEIPMWTDDTVGKLDGIFELLDQVYGKEIKDPEGVERLGSHLMGIISTRVLVCKSLAATMESRSPGYRQKIALLFGHLTPEEMAKPFMKVLKFLWGPDLSGDLGYLASLQGRRTRYVIRDNIFGAEKVLAETKDLLITNDQDPKSRAETKLFNYFGFGWDVVRVVAEEATGKKRR